MVNLSHNDAASADDAFKQQAFIAQVCDLIKDCQPPKGIGINGYWGTGKLTMFIFLVPPEFRRRLSCIFH